MRSPLIFAALLTLACTRASSPDSADPRPSRGCRRADPPPTLAPTSDLEPIASHVTLDVAVTEARLKEEIARELPEVLDSGQQTVSGFRVNYVVRRDDLAFELSDDRLVLSTDITASASVCKTFGPLCPVLGRCGPKLETRASVPVVLKRDYTYDPSEVDVELVRGCTIAGFDASREIQRRAASEALHAQRQIDRSLPAIRPLAAAGWTALNRSIELDGQTCLRVRPRTVTQARPHQADGVLSAAASIGGELTIEHPCADDAAPASTELPPLEVSDAVARGIALRAPLRMTWADVLGALHAGFDDRLSAGHLAVQSALIQGKPRLVLELERENDPCGPVWLAAEPWYDAEFGVIRLRQVGLVPDWKPGRELDELLALVERDTKIPLPLDLEAFSRQLDRARQGWLPRIDELDIDVQLDPPRVERVLLDPNGLVAVIAVGGHASIRGE